MPRLVLILAGFLLLLLVMTDKSLRWSRLALLGAFAVATVLLLHFLFYRMDMHKAQEFINRVVVVTSLSIWVVAAHFKLLGRSERENLLVFAGLVAIALFMSLSSESQTSAVALAAGLVAYVMTRFWPVLAPRLVTVGAAALALFMPVIVYGLSSLPLGWDELEFFQAASMKSRMHIWLSHMEGIVQRPFLGWGLDATRTFQDAWLPPDTRIFGVETLRMGAHCHNAFLQFWFDLGALGAVAMTALVGAVGWRTQLIAVSHRPLAVALFAAIVTVMAVSHGAYQSWWLACVVILMLAFPRETISEPEPV